MVVGLLLGRTIPGIGEALDTLKIDTVSLPVALGLLVMMYPPLAKVRYGELGRVTSDRRLLLSSLVLNWVIGPACRAGSGSTSRPWTCRCGPGGGSTRPAATPAASRPLPACLVSHVSPVWDAAIMRGGSGRGCHGAGVA